MIDLTTENPLMAGLSTQLQPQPCSFVIFGGAGDLTRRKLLAGLYNLALDGVLPANFCVIGFARTALNDDSYRELARESVEKFSRRAIQEPYWSDFVRRLHWVSGPFDEPEAYAALGERLAELEPSFGIPNNRIYYLSIAPSLINPTRRASIRPWVPGVDGRHTAIISEDANRSSSANAGTTGSSWPAWAARATSRPSPANRRAT